MKITVTFEEGEEELELQVDSAVKGLINWFQITDAYRKIWSKDVITAEWTSDHTLEILSDELYEKMILTTIENAKYIGLYE